MNLKQNRRYLMSNKWFKHHRGIGVVAGLLAGVLMAVPVCWAGGAVTIVQDQHQLAPRGSYIPKRRVEQVLKEVEEFKAKREAGKAVQQESRPETQPEESTLPKPESSKE
jgi:hypothetical protein